jgi:hypothetical protein
MISNQQSAVSNQQSAKAAAASRRIFVRLNADR